MTKLHLMDERDTAGRAISSCGQVGQSTGPEIEAIILRNIASGLKRGEFNADHCPDCVRIFKAKHRL